MIAKAGVKIPLALEPLAGRGVLDPGSSPLRQPQKSAGADPRGLYQTVYVSASSMNILEETVCKRNYSA